MMILSEANPISAIWESSDCVMCFFFSSRRRHTRLQGDWSSDVCSSDLGLDTVRVGLTQYQVALAGLWPAVRALAAAHASEREAVHDLETGETAHEEAAEQIGRASCRERV